jgi:hypothetical protein
VKRNYIVYLITCLPTNEKYVGITRLSLQARWKTHIYGSRYERNKHKPLYKVMNQYGIEDFKIEVLFYCNSEKYLDEMERYFTIYYNTLHPNGLNNTVGGQRTTFCKLASDAIKNSWTNKVIRDLRITNMKHSAEYRAKPLIGINRFDLSILEYDSINSYIKAGHSWGQLRAILNGKGKHAHNYYWFHKTHNNIERYKKEAIKRLGSMYQPSSSIPLIGTHIKTGEIINLTSLEEASNNGYDKKKIRLCLNGKNNHHKGYMWRFNN